LTIQIDSAGVVPNSPAMVGRATLATDPSITASVTASATVAYAQ